MFQCPHEDAIAICSHAITKFQTTLTEMKTATLVKQMPYYKVAQWCKNWVGVPPRLPINDKGTLLSSAVETQDNLGWNNFIKGCVSHY
eukprot:3291491-Ditylum_brightwellii.AAC.1